VHHLSVAHVRCLTLTGEFCAVHTLYEWSILFIGCGV
jgi:hypothetical protein